MNTVGIIMMSMIFIITFGSVAFFIGSIVRHGRTRRDLPITAIESDEAGRREGRCVTFTNEYALIHYGMGSEAVPLDELVWFEAILSRRGRSGVGVYMHLKNGKSKYFASSRYDFEKSKVAQSLYQVNSSIHYTDWTTPQEEYNHIKARYKEGF